jgi:hypothetical protein
MLTYRRHHTWSSLVMHLGNIILGLGGFWRLGRSYLMKSSRLQRQSISSSNCASTSLHDVLGPSACLVSTLWGSSTLSWFVATSMSWERDSATL